MDGIEVFPVLEELQGVRNAQSARVAAGRAALVPVLQEFCAKMSGFEEPTEYVDDLGDTLLSYVVPVSFTTHLQNTRDDAFFVSTDDFTLRYSVGDSFAEVGWQLLSADFIESLMKSLEDVLRFGSAYVAEPLQA